MRRLASTLTGRRLFPIEAATATTEYESRASAMSKPKSPAYSIDRHRSCGLPGTSNARCLASLDRLSQWQHCRSARAATTLDYITGTAVLEFGSAETLPPGGA